MSTEKDNDTKNGQPIIITGGSLTIRSPYAFDYRYDAAAKEHIYECREDKKSTLVRHKDKTGKEKFKDNDSDFEIEIHY